MDSFEIDYFRPKKFYAYPKGVLIVKIGISIHLSNGAEILEILLSSQLWVNFEVFLTCGIRQVIISRV